MGDQTVTTIAQLPKPTRHRTPWTTSEIKRANDLLTQGHSRKEVATILGRTVFGVRTHLPRKKRPTKPDRHDVQEMVADELTCREMADTLKVDISTIQRWLRGYRLRIARRGPAPDPYIRAQLMNLISQGHNSRGALCTKLQRDHNLVWQWLTELLEDKLITKTGQGRATRYYITKRWITRGFDE